MANTAVNDDVLRVSDALEAASRNLEQSGVGDLNSLTLSTGVVIGIVRVSPMVFQEIDSRFQDPPVPKVYDEERGRELENPMHPAYLAEVERIKNAKSIAALDAIAAIGTYLISVPDGFESPDSEDWKEKMDFLGYDQKLIDRKLTRYLAWLKMIGAPDVEQDWNTISIAVLRKSGVTEADVQNAIANFRNSGEGKANNTGEAPA